MFDPMRTNEAITLTRDCDAILIPAGDPITLKAGSTVIVTQALGGTCTVYINGNLARVEGKDFDALGFEPVAETPKVPVSGGTVDETMIWDQLRTCYDPEIPINIVDLGLVYDCTLSLLPEGGRRVDIAMTLTAPGCGIGPILVEEVKYKISALPGVSEVNVDLVFDPPWSYDRMSEAARLETGMY
jgi:probable FeS assembly SUF system protein SufT